MAEITIPIPKLDGEKAAKIAQSDKWGALSRIASVFAAGVTTIFIAPLVIWGFVTIQQSAVTLATHTGDIGTIKSDVADIKKQDGQDHDWVTTLKTEVEGQNGLIVQLGLLWHRPATSGNKIQQ